MIRLSRRMILAAVLLAGLVQSAFLGKMITDRAALIRDGQEVILQTGFVDPRDLFRGHYVVLNLIVSRLDAPEVTLPVGVRSGADVWAELKPGADGFWTVRQLHSALPEQTNGPLLRGTLVYSNGEQHLVRYPIDRYFAPKLRAQELENIRAKDALGVILALSKTGEAAIKGITIEGERIYEEPLY